MPPTIDVTNTYIAKRCEDAKKNYLTFREGDARLEFSFQLQGFVAAEMERGYSFPRVCDKIGELILMLAKVNDEELTQLLTPTSDQQPKP